MRDRRGSVYVVEPMHFSFIHLLRKSDFETLCHPAWKQALRWLERSLAAIDSEPRQARKGATVVIDSGAEVWLFESPPNNRRAHYELSSSCTKVATIQLLSNGWARACR